MESGLVPRALKQCIQLYIQRTLGFIYSFGRCRQQHPWCSIQSKMHTYGRYEHTRWKLFYVTNGIYCDRESKGLFTMGRGGGDRTAPNAILARHVEANRYFLYNLHASAARKMRTAWPALVHANPGLDRGHEYHTAGNLCSAVVAW